MNALEKRRFEARHNDVRAPPSYDNGARNHASDLITRLTAVKIRSPFDTML
jgi:hypothetical protein